MTGIVATKLVDVATSATTASLDIRAAQSTIAATQCIGGAAVLLATALWCLAGATPAFRAAHRPLWEAAAAAAHSAQPAANGAVGTTGTRCGMARLVAAKLVDVATGGWATASLDI